MIKNRDLKMYGFIIIIAIVLLWGCATTRTPISEETFFKVWSGTWVNPDIEGSVWIPEKIVAHPDGAFDIFVYASDEVNFCHHEIEIIDQWIDSDGNIWFTAKTTCPVNPDIYFQHGRIKESGNTLEFIHRGGTPIEKWEPNGEYYYYCIYYRE